MLKYSIAKIVASYINAFCIEFKFGWQRSKGTHIAAHETEKQTTPIDKWIGNVSQNFSLFRNTLSEMTVVRLERNRNNHPRGMHSRNENEEEFCTIKYNIEIQK